MKKLSLMLMVLFAVSAMAQDRGNVFGGYSLNRSQGENDHGWNAAVTFKVKGAFGVKVDTDGHYNSLSIGGTTYRFKAHRFMGGAELAGESGIGRGFVHVLAGVQNERVTNFGSVNSFVFGLGGGFDLKASDRLSFRLAQVDWLRARNNGLNDDNLRFSTGVVVKF